MTAPKHFEQLKAGDCNRALTKEASGQLRRRAVADHGGVAAALCPARPRRLPRLPLATHGPSALAASSFLPLVFLSWRPTQQRRLLQTEDRGRFGSGPGSAQTLGQGGRRAGREQAARGPLTLAAPPSSTRRGNNFFSGKEPPHEETHNHTLRTASAQPSPRGGTGARHPVPPSPPRPPPPHLPVAAGWTAKVPSRRQAPGGDGSFVLTTAGTRRHGHHVADGGAGVAARGYGGPRHRNPRAELPVLGAAPFFMTVLLRREHLTWIHPLNKLSRVQCGVPRRLSAPRGAAGLTRNATPAGWNPCPPTPDPENHHFSLPLRTCLFSTAHVGGIVQNLSSVTGSVL